MALKLQQDPLQTLTLESGCHPISEAKVQLTFIVATSQ